MIAVCFLSAVLPPLLWEAEGRAEAERDIAAGTMKLKIYGHFAGLTATDAIAREKLRERFGIELVAVAQCVVSAEQVANAEAYNDRIREEVEGTHSARAIRKVWDDGEDTHSGGVIDQIWVEADQEARSQEATGELLLWSAVVAVAMVGIGTVLLVRGRERKSAGASR